MSRLPRALDASHLVLSHFTLARHHPIGDRVASAAAGGFDAIGLFVGDVARLPAEGIDLEQIADLLDEHDLGLADIEVARGWGGGPDPAAGTAADAETVAWRLADRFGCRCLQAIGPYRGNIADAGRAFRALCERAADHGLVVALEPLPYTNIPDMATAIEIVERAGHPSGGLCVDIWHHTRAGDDRARLRSLGTLGPDRIMCVQMSDGPRRAPSDDLAAYDYKDDCLRNRVPPGEGEMDAAGFVAALLAAGTTVPWSVEVCAEAAWERPGADHVRRCGEAMRRVLAQARTTTGTTGATGTTDVRDEREGTPR